MDVDARCVNLMRMRWSLKRNALNFDGTVKTRLCGRPKRMRIARRGKCLLRRVEMAPGRHIQPVSMEITLKFKALFDAFEY